MSETVETMRNLAKTRISTAKTEIESSITACSELVELDEVNAAFYMVAVAVLQEAADKLGTLITKQQINDGQGTPIEELDLSVRAWRCLERAGIKTVEDLVKMSPNEVKKIRNLGLRAFMEIVAKLEDRGLSLRRY